MPVRVPRKTHRARRMADRGGRIFSRTIDSPVARRRFRRQPCSNQSQFIISSGARHELTSAMHHQRRAVPALPPPESPGDAALESFGELNARIPPLSAPSDWLRDFGKVEPAAPLDDPELCEDVGFWSRQTTYPPLGGPSTPPPALIVPASGPRAWLARSLFIALFGSALGLLVCEAYRMIPDRASAGKSLAR